METFLQQLSNGISRGVIYALVALALVLIFRATNLVNFAQGEMALFSAFLCAWLATDHMGIVPAVLLTVAISFVAGALIELILIRPVEDNRSPLNVVIITLGMFLAINAIAQIVFIRQGQEAIQMPRLFPRGSVVQGFSKATAGQALILIGECLLIYLILQRTKVGLKLRAAASNRESAKLAGINTSAMLMLGWGLAAAIGAMAGILNATRTDSVGPAMMQQVLVYAFAATALGGFDSLLGAVVGGLVVGIADSLTIQYVGALSGISVVVPFVLILVVLLVRPNGLFGRQVVERV